MNSFEIYSYILYKYEAKNSNHNQYYYLISYKKLDTMFIVNIELTGQIGTPIIIFVHILCHRPKSKGVMAYVFGQEFY